MTLRLALYSKVAADFSAGCGEVGICTSPGFTPPPSNSKGPHWLPAFGVLGNSCVRPSTYEDIVLDSPYTPGPGSEGVCSAFLSSSPPSTSVADLLTRIPLLQALKLLVSC
jgi:hypothetical protein